MSTRVLTAVSLLLLTGILAVPFVLRPHAAGGGVGAEAGRSLRRLIVVTPHTEQIRYEFGRAFEAWHLKKYGEGVRVDWRAPGGTTEIFKILESQFEAAARDGKFTFTNPKQPSAPVGTIPFSVMFGGGSFDHGRLKTGMRLKLPVDKASPLQPVTPDDPVVEVSIPMSVSAGFDPAQMIAWFGDNWIGSQTLYDPDQYWIGTALSSFGVVYNKDLLKRLGVKEPTQFADLADPRLVGAVALADPRQSGSITTTFDSILSWYVWDLAKREGWEAELSAAFDKERSDPAHPAWESSLPPQRADSVQRAWDKGWRVLREMTANARSFSNMATKPPYDVSQGEAAAGLAIDFYGRSQGQSVLAPGEKAEDSRVGYVDPVGAVYIDADPVSILRGGHEPELARRFVEFCLTDAAQALWQFPPLNDPRSGSNPAIEPGERSGPVLYALRRLPVRRAMYAEPYRAHLMDQVDPFAIASRVRPVGWRPAIGLLMGAFSIDVLEEQRRAWIALNRARATKGADPAVVGEMERLFYAFPAQELQDGTVLPLNAANFRRIREGWRQRGVLAKAGIDYTAFFRANYARVIVLERSIGAEAAPAKGR